MCVHMGILIYIYIFSHTHPRGNSEVKRMKRGWAVTRSYNVKGYTLAHTYPWSEHLEQEDKSLDPQMKLKEWF